MEPTDNCKLEKLKIAYERQTIYLSLFTTVDFKLFVGYITLQLAFAGWMVSGPLGKDFSFVHLGLLIVDTSMAFVAWHLLSKNQKRREEEISKLRNITEALGYFSKGAFLSDDRPLFEKGIGSRPSLTWYKTVIVSIWIGVTLVLVGPTIGCY